jgi:hypothetical protein
MSRKHFQLLADHLALSQPERVDGESEDHFYGRIGQWNNDVAVIADACALANERFDRRRFIAACGAAGATLVGPHSKY